MSKGPWMRIDPEVHLKGATPETLAAALLRPVKPLKPGKKKAADDGTPAANTTGRKPA